MTALQLKDNPLKIQWQLSYSFVMSNYFLLPKESILHCGKVARMSSNMVTHNIESDRIWQHSHNFSTVLTNKLFIKGSTTYKTKKDANDN